ncbi:MAG: hypothetical protein KTR31_04420 [Myxococcales bacterium]|nr:hypothetical protein [Myxococcales bacterium]
MRVTFSMLVLLAACDAEAPPDGEVPEAIDYDQFMLYGLASNYWSDSEIPVCWETSGDATEKGWVEDELTGPRSWSNFADVSFTGWGDCTSSSVGIRISAGTSMVVTGGLGDQGGTSTMELDFSATPQNTWTTCVANSLSREDCIRAVSLHEFGHSLGFAHEQRRNDTPTSCTTGLNSGSQGDTEIGDWDADSVMNYCAVSTELSLGDELGVLSAYGGPFPGWSPCSDSTYPCPSKVGDCDVESDCADGTTCVHDVGDLFGWSSAADVCLADGDMPFPGWAYCTPASPCTTGLGDCDSDADCAAGTICLNDVGAEHGWSSLADLCVQTVATFPGWSACSAASPCPAGSGDCDSDAECEAGTRCADDIGPTFGFPDLSDVCVPDPGYSIFK